jgi:hypothetical protein
MPWFWAQCRRRNNLFSRLDFMAEFTQHILPKGAHLIRYYGFYSKRSRGMRKKAEAEKAAEPSSRGDPSGAARTACSKTGAMLQVARALSQRQLEKYPTPNMSETVHNLKGGNKEDRTNAGFVLLCFPSFFVP